MSVKFKENDNWNMLSFSIQNLGQLNNELIIKNFKSKYDKDYDKINFNIIDILTSITNDRLAGQMYIVTICYSITK